MIMTHVLQSINSALEIYERLIAISQKPFSNLVHLSQTSIHSWNLFGEGGSLMAIASIFSGVYRYVSVRVGCTNIT